MKVLLSAFDPFGGESINPALEALNLVNENLEGITLKRIEIPTVFKNSLQTLLAEAREFKPDVILSIGQAGGRYDITMERVAINIDDARICDNANQQPIDEIIYPDGENAYFSNLPIKSIVANLKEANIPASVSNTAGTFVCNHVMYGVLYEIQKSQVAKMGGFMHVPYVPEQVLDKKNTPYMSKESITKAIEIALTSTKAYFDTLKS